MKRHVRFVFILGTLLFLMLVWVAGPVSAQQDRGMGVPADAMPQDLQKLDVKDYFVPSVSREAGVLHAQNGHVVVVHRASGAAYFGKPGDKIYENDELNTLEDSRCRIRFYTDDVVNMAPDTRFAVESFEDRRADRKKESFFSMVKGKAMFYALRLFRYKDTRFKVKTPTAVVGVRGTKFGLDVFWQDEGRKARSDGIQVADSGRGFEAYLAQAGAQGRRSGTVAACGDGELDLTDPVTGKVLTRVSPNEHFNTATQMKGYDRQNRILNGIANASMVREEGEGEPREPTDGAVEGEGPVGDDTGLPDTTLLAGTLTDIALQQTGETSHGEICPYLVGTDSYPLYGYFSALLLRQDWSIKDAISSFTLQQLDPTHAAMGYGAESTNHQVEANGDDPTWAEVSLAMAPSSGPIRVDEGPVVGLLNYLQWGYDLVSTEVFFAGGENLQFVQKAWWLEGYPTSPTELAAMSGNYSYSGDVDGTYYNLSGTVDISGTYSCDVHFGSSYVENFVLEASGGGNTVNFTQAGIAEIDTLGQFGSDPTNFPTDPLDGTFEINGSSVSYWHIHGAHYGHNAAEQGGAFAGYNDSTDEGAYGVFGGQQQ
jgi:hypothetical protein